MSRRFRAALILIAGIGAGSLRDFLFINLNYQIDHVQRSTPASFAHSRFQEWTAGWDLAGLVRLKWGLALLFILCMWGLCQLLLRNARSMRRTGWAVTWVFLGIAGTALFLQILARWWPLEEASVNLLHAIQYPVLLLVLQVALMVFPGHRSMEH